MAKKEEKKSTKKNESSMIKTITIWTMCVGGIYGCFMFNAYIKEVM